MRSLLTLLLAAFSLQGIHPALSQAPVEAIQFRLGVEEARLDAPMEKLRESYRAGLEKLADANQAARFPQRALALREELAGFAYDRIAPANDFIELDRMQEIYDQEASRLALQRAQALKILLQNTRVELRTLESRLRREGTDFQAKAAAEAAAALGLRLDQLRKRLAAMNRSALERISTRSRPSAAYSGPAGLVAKNEWAEGLAMDWVLGGPTPAIVDHWSLRLAGRIRVPAYGTYALTGFADDKVTLTIAGKILAHVTIDNPSQHDFGSLELTPGWHPFTLDFGEGVSGASFKVQWSGPGFEMREITAHELAGPASPSRSRSR